MSEFKLGERVRVKDRADWPSPPGYRLAGVEGVVTKWSDWEGIFEEFSNYVYILVHKNVDGNEQTTGLFIRAEDLEKI